MSTRDRGEPYRSTPAVAPPPSSGEPPPTLGARRSRHFRKDLQGTVARILGWSPAVEIHEGGLVVWGGTPERVEILFDDVDAIFYDYESLLPRPRPRVTLVTGDGRRADLARDLSGLDQILLVLHRQITRDVVVRAVEALKRGEAMTFGPVIIELEGVRLRNELLAWDELSRVIVGWDTIVIHAAEPVGRFGWVPIRDVPHPRALLETLRVRGSVVLSGRSADPGG